MSNQLLFFLCNYCRHVVSFLLNKQVASLFNVVLASMSRVGQSWLALSPDMWMLWIEDL